MKTHALALILTAATLVRPAAAVQINLTYDTGGAVGSVPGADPAGARLMALAEAAAAYWEDIIKDAHVLDLTVRYDNGINPAFIGLFTEVSEAGGRITEGIVSIRGTTPWYYDPSPENHSEYGMGARLYRNALAGDPNNFTGSVPGVFEINFMGTAGVGAPPLAQSNTDLYTTLLHEIGHALGMTTSLSTCAAELLDNDYDLNPAHTNGNVMSAVLGGNTGAHVACQQCVMNPNIPAGFRRLPCAGDVLALATCPNPGWSQIDLPRKDFLPGGTMVWNTAANWVGGRLPDAADEAFLRYGSDVPGDPLISLSAAAVCGNLTLANATRLRTLAHKLDVTGTALVEFDGTLPAPEIFVESSGELEATDVTVNGGELDLTGGLLDIADDLTLSAAVEGRVGILSGYGSVQVDGTLRNDGRIDAGDGQTLVFSSPAATPWDLDGTSGNGEVLALLGSLNFATGAMSDAFDGLLQIEDPYTVTFGEPWALGSGGVVRLNGGNPALATLAGAQFTATGGDIQVTGRSRIAAPVVFGGALEYIGAADSHLLLDGVTTVTGGGYLLGADAVMECNNTTGISGGAFLIPAGATVRLDATHTLSGGSFSGAGTLAFNGLQTVVDSAVTVNCDILDLDGPGGAKQVQLNAPLTVNSDQLDLSDSKFDATLNIGASPAALHINGPAAWVMAGTLNHTTGSNVFTTSLSGAPVTVSGTVNVSGSTRWDARATLSGSIALGAGTSRLALQGGSAENPNRIAGGTVSGTGSLRAQDSHLRGFGSIASGIDFPGGSSLLADDGTLLLSGPLISVPSLIGTADADGVLEVASPWTLPAGRQLQLLGGIARGAAITLQGHLSGHGLLQSSSIVNNGAIAATAGQTLTMDTAGAPDLDGTGTAAQVSEHLMEAVQGNIVVTKAPLDAFGATLQIGSNRTVTFQNGWTLDTTGALQLAGSTLAGGLSVLRGEITVASISRMTAPAVFESGVTVTIADPEDELQLAADSSFHSGASFSGSGLLRTTAGMSLTLSHNAAVGVALHNEGRLVPAAGAGQAVLAAFSQSAGGTLSVDILGAPAGSAYDHLTVTGAAHLHGTLEIVFNVAGAKAGDTWRILSAASVTGSFTQLTAAGVPAGHQLLPLITSDGVYVKLTAATKYADWAAALGLTPLNDSPAADPDLDGIGNALEMILGGNPLKPEPHLTPQGSLIKVDGKYYLSITLPASLAVMPEDVTLQALRSTDLLTWDKADTLMEITGYDPALCIEYRRFRSSIPFNSLHREYLKVIATGP